MTSHSRLKLQLLGNSHSEMHRFVAAINSLTFHFSPVMRFLDNRWQRYVMPMSLSVRVLLYVKFILMAPFLHVFQRLISSPVSRTVCQRCSCSLLPMNSHQLCNLKAAGRCPGCNRVFRARCHRWILSLTMVSGGTTSSTRKM